MEKNNVNNPEDDWYNLDQIKAYMKVPAIKKLDQLEENARFLFNITPEKYKKKWEQLKDQGL